jgi:hypothetical protein
MPKRELYVSLIAIGEKTSTDDAKTPFSAMVCYKETHANAVIDPSDPPTWTGGWRNPRFSSGADGGGPENALVGTIDARRQSDEGQLSARRLFGEELRTNRTIFADGSQEVIR